MTDATPLASEQITQALLDWQPDYDDRTEPLLLAEASRRDARDWNRNDAQNVIAFLLAALSASPAPSGQGVSGDEFTTLEPWEHDDQRELSLLYNHRPDDRLLQFNRGQMREAIRRGKRLAAPAPSCAPGEVEWLAIWGGVNERDRMHGGGYCVRWPGYGYKSPTFSDSDAAYAELARLRATAILAALSPQGLDAKEGGKITQAAVDAALDAEWATDAGGDVPAVGQSYSIREAMEEFGANLSTREIENAMHTALAAALNPPGGNEWAITYDREGPR